jgi:endonuclease III-like uncharacterized protein
MQDYKLVTKEYLKSQLGIGNNAINEILTKLKIKPVAGTDKYSPKVLDAILDCGLEDIQNATVYNLRAERRRAEVAEKQNEEYELLFAKLFITMNEELKGKLDSMIGRKMKVS